MLAILELYIFQHVYRVKYCSSFHFPPQCKFHWLQWMAFRSVKKWQESILCRRWPTDWKWKVFNGLCRKTTISEDLRILVAKNKKDFRDSCIQGSGPLMNDSKTMSGRLRDFHCIMQSWWGYFAVLYFVLGCSIVEKNDAMHELETFLWCNRWRKYGKIYLLVWEEIYIYM